MVNNDIILSEIENREELPGVYYKPVVYLVGGLSVHKTREGAEKKFNEYLKAIQETYTNITTWGDYWITYCDKDDEGNPFKEHTLTIEEKFLED